MNFTLEKNKLDFLPRFYRLSFVAVLSNMMIPLAGICDTAFLGHLKNIQPLAGVILASILFDYLYRILKFLRNSTNTMTAQAVGENEDTEVILAGLRSALIAIAIAFTILILQYPIQKLGFAILSGTPEIEASGIEYFNARIWGAPAVLLNIVKYTVWLLPLLAFTAIAFMLEAYFIGLKKSAVLRNASLIALILVFIPLVILTLKIQSVNLLWFSLTCYMVTLILVLASKIFSTQKTIDVTLITEADA